MDWLATLISDLLAWLGLTWRPPVPLTHPVGMAYGISSPYGMRISPISGERSMHRGTDYATPTGATLYAPFAGRVIRVDVADDGRMDGNGNAVLLESADVGGERWRFIALHLSSVRVRAGDSVRQGQVLGATGATGRVTGPHVHVEFSRRFADGRSRVFTDPDAMWTLEPGDTIA